MSTSPAVRSERIAVVGSHDDVAAFKAAGLAVFATGPGRTAVELVSEAIRSGHRVVFFTEDLFPELGPLLERHRRAAVPCLVALPTAKAGVSVARLKEIVRRAVGADIFGSGRNSDIKGVD